MQTEFKIGDNVIHSNVHGTWTGKITQILGDNWYKIRYAIGFSVVAPHMPDNTRKDTITKFSEKQLFVAS